MTALNNVTTADVYTEQNTLHVPGATRLTLYARNAAIFYQLGTGFEGVQWDEAVFFPPGTLGADRVFDHVRVKSAVPGVPAQVTIDAG